MKIVGFNIKKITAERKTGVKDKLEVKSGLDVENITSETINISDKPSIKFDFSFTLDYSPDVGFIEMKGSVIAIDDNDEGKDILRDWKKKKFEHPIKLPLFNFILDKCNLRTLQLEEEVDLPFHIPFPKLAVQHPQQGNSK